MKNWQATPTEEWPENGVLMPTSCLPVVKGAGLELELFFFHWSSEN